MTARALGLSGPRRPLAGDLSVPGDKSISHRALILAAVAEGSTPIEGLAPGRDVAATRRCLEALGAGIEGSGRRILVKGRGPGGLAQPAGTLDAENSGTTMRLLMGLAAGYSFRARLDGDESLRRRPMGRVAEPLRALGAEVSFEGAEGRAPLCVRGGSLRGTAVTSRVASAQVKSAVLLAGLFAEGETSFTEPALSRDHTERLLGHFRVVVKREGLTVKVGGKARLRSRPISVPGDPSSAAFWAAAACLVPGSRLTVRGVCANPTRTGFFDALRRMGAEVAFDPAAPGPGGEPVADIRVGYAPLSGIETSAGEFPAFVDEAPLLALLGARAEGVTRIRGVGELRHKESDRVAAILGLLKAFGAEARAEADDLVIEGPQDLRGGRVDPAGDHRIAMAAAVAALAARGESAVEDPACADVSYPGFFDELSAMARGA